MPPYSSPFTGALPDDGGVLNRSSRRRAGASSGFTTNLLDTIVISKTKMNAWVKHEKAKADAVAESYRQRLNEQQTLIDKQATELLTVQMARGMKLNHTGSVTTTETKSDNIVARKKALEEETTALQIEIMRLQTERDNRERRVNEISLEEKKQRVRANEARIFKEQVEDNKKTTLDDLTRGVVNYKMLGLDFVSTDRDGRLRFSYTKVDPSDPSREFSFLLVVDDDEKFDIVDCQPPLDATELVAILEDLNRTEDMSVLARRMRKVFKNCV